MDNKRDKTAVLWLQKAGCRRQVAEGRLQKAGCRRQVAEGRLQKEKINGRFLATILLE